jgi:hypothetical protein
MRGGAPGAPSREGRYAERPLPARNRRLEGLRSPRGLDSGPPGSSRRVSELTLAAVALAATAPSQLDGVGDQSLRDLLRHRPRSSRENSRPQRSGMSRERAGEALLPVGWWRKYERALPPRVEWRSSRMRQCVHALVAAPCAIACVRRSEVACFPRETLRWCRHETRFCRHNPRRAAKPEEKALRLAGPS